MNKANKLLKNLRERSDRPYLSLSLLVAYAILIFLASYYNVWQGDDLNYRMVITPENSAALYDGDKTQVEGIGDILESQYHHYYNVNGRFVAHTMVQMFCGLYGQVWFSIFNALFHVLLILGVLRLTGGSVWHFSEVLTVVLLVVLGLSNRMTPSCQIGYTWMFALNVWFLYCFFKPGSRSFISGAVLMVYSLIAGWSQESLVIGLAGALGIYCLINIKRLTALQYFMAGAYFAGGLLLCLSPGSIHRAGGMATPFMLSLINFMCYVRAFYILVAVVLYKVLLKKRKIKEIYVRNQLFVNALVILLVFNFVLGVSGNRQLLGIELVSIIIVLRLMPGHSFTGLWLAVLGGLVVSQLVMQFRYTLESHRIYEKMIRDYEVSADGTVRLNISTLPNTDWLVLDNYSAYLGLLLKIDYPRLMERNEIRRIYGKGKDIKILPAYTPAKPDVVKPIVCEIAPNEWLMVKGKGDTAEFKVYRSLKVGPVRLPFRPFTVSSESMYFNEEGWTGSVFGDSDMYHLTVDSVEVLN